MNNSNQSTFQDVNIAILAVWSVIATGSILLVDHKLFLLSLALLVMIEIVSIARIFPFAAILSTFLASIIYAVTYFSIFHYTGIESVFAPLTVVLILGATGGLCSMLMRAINRNVVRMRKDLQLLSDLIQYDSETGLLLWKHARTRLDTELARCRRYQKTFAFLMLETSKATYEYLETNDRKEIDTAIARLLLKTSRNDVDISFVGNHFGVILPETDAAGAVAFARRLLANAAKVTQLDLRIAVATFPEDGVTPEELIANCEAALQLALASETPVVTAASIRKEPSPQIEMADITNAEALAARGRTQLEGLAADEFLFTLLGFQNLADLPRIQTIISANPAVTDLKLIEYANGRLVFILKGNTDLTKVDFREDLKEYASMSWKVLSQKDV